jgi:hypothetical protein
MRFAFERRVDLPRLAWCARVASGADVVELRHGPGVEAHGDFFAEGAWAGAFGAGRIDEATTVVGTGGRARPDAAVFTASSGRRDRVYAARGARELWISNSPVFALVASGDEPAPDFRGYLGEFTRQVRLGVRRTRRALPTRRGELWLFESGNVEARPDLSLTRVEPPPPPPPRDFAEYVASLEAALDGVFANASAPERGHGFRPLATLSRGYDAPAVAALAARLGCREAVTFSHREEGQAEAADDGTEIGKLLGYAVTTLERDAWAARPGMAEAEFCVLPPGFDVVWSAAEELLAGSLLLFGFGGDLFWTLQQLGAGLSTPGWAGLAALSGTTLLEFRLRVGFHCFPVPTVGWQQASAISAISRSDEMAPWRVGGDYDRPIPRRIVEQAGVPRGSFARTKLGTALHMLRAPEDLRSASRRDFEAFLRERLGAAAVARLRALHALYRRSAGATRALNAATGARLRAPLKAHRPGTGGFLPHWGFERIRSRYEGASGAALGGEA